MLGYNTENAGASGYGSDAGGLAVQWWVTDASHGVLVVVGDRGGGMVLLLTWKIFSTQNQLIFREPRENIFVFCRTKPQKLQ